MAGGTPSAAEDIPTVSDVAQMNNACSSSWQRLLELIDRVAVAAAGMNQVALRTASSGKFGLEYQQLDEFPRTERTRASSRTN